MGEERNTIMKKLVGGIVIILALAAVGFIGAAYWSGIQAERWYRDSLLAGANSSPNIQFTTLRYERGWFSSQAVTRIQIERPKEGETQEADPSFSLRQDIYHGPLPLAGRNAPEVPMAWGGAVVRATLDSESSAWTRELAKWYGVQEPLVAISRVGFDGASDTQITMPPLILSNVGDLQSLNFAGLQGQFQASPRGEAVRGTMRVSSLDLVGQPESADQTLGGGQIKLSELSLNVNQRKGVFDLLFGESSFNIAELRVRDPANDTAWVATGLTLTGTFEPQDSQQVGGEVVIKAENISMNQQSGTGSLRLALRNLDGPTIMQLQQWQQRSASQPDDPQALDELLAFLKTLLRGKPELVLDTQAKLTEGEWLVRLTLNFQDFDADSLFQDPAGALNALEKGLAEAAISQNLVETLLADRVEEELRAQAGEEAESGSDQALRSMAEQQATEQLQGLIAAGFIRLEGGQYRSIARFEGGRLFVNDQEIPLLPPAGEMGLPGEESLPLGPQ